MDSLWTAVDQNTQNREVREVTVVADVLDVAAYILEKQGAITAMKLQKLCYYSKAWHLVWEERALFPNRIEAWANGPVIPDLYRAHRGQFRVEELSEGSSAWLDENERESIDIVMEAYGSRSAHDLSELSHREDPWRDARHGIPDGARSQSEISDAALMEYFDAQTTAP